MAELNKKVQQDTTKTTGRQFFEMNANMPLDDGSDDSGADYDDSDEED